MNARLQVWLFGPYFSSFSAHSYGYELLNELKSDLKLPDFRFGPYSQTGSRRLPDSECPAASLAVWSIFQLLFSP
jgi:hypothetical protein